MWSNVLYNFIQFWITSNKTERDKISFWRENERKLMRSNNCIIKEIEIASFRGRRVYHDMHIVICIHLSVNAFLQVAFARKESTKSLIIYEIIPDINWRDFTCWIFPLQNVFSHYIAFLCRYIRCRCEIKNAVQVENRGEQKRKVTQRNAKGCQKILQEHVALTTANVHFE